MDKRSWPWKKKSSEKPSAEKSIATSDSTLTPQTYQEINKKPKYVQISVETYTHLTGLEDEVKEYEEQVKSLEEEVNKLNEKLSAADTEITNKEALVKQHTKVAQEAVAGWEKAEDEAATLKSDLESVTLLKLTAEDRATHLDGALKECMRQIRNLKEEHEQNVQEIILSQTKKFDKMKLDFETKMANLDQELLRSAAENAALSRSLQERSNMLVNISEEKSEAEAEIEVMKIENDSYQREINSLKYEMHILSKEVEIRNEEKNMSVRSAEAANKQHLEGVKKIAKLESECQRLRGLVRKKLPGPAAMAQMKLEVENLGHDYGEAQTQARVRRSPGKPPSPHSPQFSDFPENIQKFHQQNDFLTERLMVMEEENKMLKEALAMRNSELQASRSMCAKTINKLQSLEAQVEGNSQLLSPSKKANNGFHNEGLLTHSFSSPPSFTSISEDGNEDQESCAGLEKPKNSESVSRLELMDDFLEMEKLAYSSNISNGAVSAANQETNPVSSVEDLESGADSSPLKKFQSRISVLINSIPKDADLDKILDVIKHSVQKNSDAKALSDEAEVASEKEIITSEDISSLISDDLALAISQVHDFIIFLEKEAISGQGSSPDEDELSHKIQNFSLTLNSVIQGKTSLKEFVLDLSHVLNKAIKLQFNILGSKNSESETSETNGSDCIDKVALPDIPQIESSEKCDEFEQMKQEKSGLELELAKNNENLESTKAQLSGTKQLLEEAKSELASAQKTNSLAETQLKCMAESYKSLETRADELQTEVNLLRDKIQNLENELEEEKNSYRQALIKCKDLEEQLQSTGDADQSNQEEELAAASERLAECQETIFLLGKQLNSLRPQTDTTVWPFHNNTKSQKSDNFHEEEPNINGINSQDYEEMNHSISPSSPSEVEGNTLLRSPIDSNLEKNKPTQNGSASSSSNPTPEKNQRSFSRFFSSKSKNGQ